MDGVARHDNDYCVDLGTGRTAKAISAGAYFTCALLDNNTVKCRGYNAYGALGQGDKSNRGDDPNEMGANLPAINLGTTIDLPPVLPPTGSNTLVVLLAALGLVGAGTIALRAQRRTA